MSSNVTYLTASRSIESTSEGGGANGRSILRPYNAAYYGGSSTETGYAKITLPVSWTGSMIMMTVDIYMYGEGMVSLKLGGYNYGTTSSWINTHGTIIGVDHSGVESIKVEWGHDGTNCAIYLSHESEGGTTTWTYPQIVVRDVHLGYTIASDTWANTAWDIGFTATLGTITSTDILENTGTVFGSGSTNAFAYWTDTDTLGYDGNITRSASGELTATTALISPIHTFADGGTSNRDYIHSSDGTHTGSGNTAGFFVFRHDGTYDNTAGTGNSTLDAGSIWLNSTSSSSLISGPLTFKGTTTTPLTIRSTDDGENAVTITRDSAMGLIGLYDAGVQGVHLTPRTSQDSWFLGGLGVGTATPNKEFHVSGDAEVSVSSIFDYYIEEIAPNGLSDYDYAVILLHEYQDGTALAHGNYCDGTFFLNRTGGNNKKDIIKVVSGTQYINQTWGYLEFDMGDTDITRWPTLCTCTYNATVYLAIQIPYTSDMYTAFSFVGHSKSLGAERNKLVPYYDNNGGGALNTEINNSIATFKGNYTKYLDNRRFILHREETTTESNISGSNLVLGQGLIINTDNYTNGGYLGGLSWNTVDNNDDVPKAAIFTSMHESGSRLYLRTSDNYGTAADKGILVDEAGCLHVNPTLVTKSTATPKLIVGSSLLSTSSSAIAQFNGFLRCSYIFTHDASQGIQPATTGQGSVGSATYKYGSGYINALYAGDGTATVPSFTFSSDTSMGMYRIGAEDLGFSTNGLERMSIDSSGLVEINSLVVGANGDTNAKLAVDGGITIYSGEKISLDNNYYVHGYMQFTTSYGTESKMLHYGYYGHTFATRTGHVYIRGDSGYMGVNNSAPSYRLDVSGNIRATSAIYSPDGTSSTPSFSFYNDTNTGLFRRGTDQIGFATAGLDRMFVDASGHFSPSTNATVNLGSSSLRWQYVYGAWHYANAGSVSSPSISFGDDTDTGLYNYATNSLAITASGTNQLIINSSKTLDVLGSFRCEYLDNNLIQTFTTSDTTAGWYPILHWGTGVGNRGKVKVTLCYVGGSWTPDTYEIEAFKHWSGSGNIKCRKWGGGGPQIGKVRIKGDASNAVHYLEVYLDANANGHQFQVRVEYDGYHDGYITLEAATLVASTNTGTSHSETDFVNYSTIDNSLSIHNYVYHNQDSDTYFGFSGADTFVAATAGSSRLTIDSSGNAVLNGGRTSGDNALTISGRFKFRGDGVLHWGNAYNHGYLSWNSTDAVVGGNSGYGFHLYSDGASCWDIETSGKLRYDKGSTGEVFEIGGDSTYATIGLVTIGHSSAGYGTIGDGYRTTTTSDSYQYDRNDYATQIDFKNGDIEFKTAASGTAGNTITWTPRLHLDNTGSATIYSSLLPDSDGVYDLGSTLKVFAVGYIGSVYTDIGGAASPTHSFHVDTNTGLYQYADDSIGFAAGGANIGYWNTTELNVVGDVDFSSELRYQSTVVVDAVSTTDVYGHFAKINAGSGTAGMWLNYGSLGTTAADLRFYANNTTLAGMIDASNQNWNLGSSTTTPDHRLVVEGSVRLTSGNGIGIGGNALTYNSRIHAVGDGTNPVISVSSSAKTTTPSSLSGRTFHGWLPITVDGVTKYLPLYN